MGNCQGTAIAAAMRVLMPGASVSEISTHGLERRYRDVDALVGHLSEHDAVFASRLPGPLRDGSDFEVLRSRLHLVQIPIVVFGAFHPDVVYVDVVEAGGVTSQARGPMGSYHSALLYFAHRQGWSAERARRLFRPDVFASLGYVHVWDDAAKTLLQLGAEAGQPLEADLLRWTRRGTFMHVINHPRMHVTSDIARTLLRRAGLSFTDCDLDAVLPDVFLPLGSWPVYPAVAEAYGVKGSELFVAPAIRGRPGRVLTLDDFVAEELAAFASYGTSRVRCARVDEWSDHPEIGQHLARLTA